MMEDFSVLKVRSDLYPYAALPPTGAMTSTPAMTPPNNPTCGTAPVDDNLDSTPALPTNSSCPTSTTLPTEAPLATDRDAGAAPSWRGVDPWRKEHEERPISTESAHQPPFREDPTLSRSHNWTASSEPMYSRHDNAKSSSEHDATPPMTPTDSDEVQGLTHDYSDSRSGVTAPKVSEDQHVPGRNPSLLPMALVKGQSLLMFPHGMSFHSALPDPVSGEASRPPPTPPDETPPYGGMHPSPSASRPDSKYSNASPRIEGQSSREGCRGTLDLSTSLRLKDAFPHQISQMASSPDISPSAFSPFGMFPGLTRFHEMNPMFGEGFEAAVPKSPYNSSLYAANLPHHLLPWLISSQIQNLVQHQQASSTDGNRGSILGVCNGGFMLEDKDQQPLDLSAKKHESKPLLDEELVARVLDIKPSTRGRRRADNSKRSYTENELLAALRDIQSGKLGTRRAAVIYGIPRSTLRNKVYKLQSNRDHGKKNIDQKEKLHQMLPDTPAHLQSTMMLSKATEADAPAEIPCEALKIMIKRKMTEKLEELSRNSQTPLSGGDKQKLLDSALTYLCENIPKLALNTDNKTITTEILSSLSLYPQLQDFTHKIVEERFYEEIRKINNNIDSAIIPEISNGYKSESVNPPISIPSYPSIYKSQPNEQSLKSEELKSDSSHPSIGSPPQTNLKDMIAQIINQKILGDGVPADLSNSNSSASFLPLSVQCMDSPSMKSSLKFPTDEKPQHDQVKKRSKSPSSSGGGKGSRPKRGKYRNYDRDNLLKAVQAVQSGEMSVHRAGSFYGVPHSTLEYKVKERHLNRGRNKKDTGVLPNVPLLKAEKENTSSSVSLASTAFAKDQFKKDNSDIVTKDMSARENHPNDEISIIGIQSPQSKKSKLSPESDEPFSSLPIPSNPFLSNPFPFWNNTSPILAPFLSSPYQAEQLYASQVMSNFQRAASKLSSSDPRTDSPPSDAKHSDPFPSEGSSRPLGIFPNAGPSSSTPPPSSPPIPQDGLLNTLLRKKMETQINEGFISWPILPPDETHAEGDPKERSSELESGLIPPAGLFTLKALLPSFIAARTSLAAAFNTDTAPPNTSRISSTSPPATSLPLLKGTSHIPVVGGASLSETP